MLTTFLRNFTVRNCQEIQDGFDLLRHDNPNAGYKQDSRDSVRSFVRSFENVFILATILIRKTERESEGGISGRVIISPNAIGGSRNRTEEKSGDDIREYYCIKNLMPTAQV